MKKCFDFTFSVNQSSAQRFAELSGDRNPLHIDPDYAKTTKFGQNILHGAFSAGLFSHLAGMYLPGKSCLLRSLKLNFIAPIFLPSELYVKGEEIYFGNNVGRVDVNILDSKTNEKYVEGFYEYTFHEKNDETIDSLISTNFSTSEYISEVPNLTPPGFNVASDLPYIINPPLLFFSA